MAVTNASELEMLNRFWPRYKRVVLLRALAAESLVIVLVVGVVVAVYPNPSIDAWIMIIILSMISFVLTVITTMLSMRPLKDLSSALVHASGEPSAQTPPNLNDSYYVRTKLRPLLKLVYDMASNQGDMPRVLTNM